MRKAIAKVMKVGTVKLRRPVKGRQTGQVSIPGVVMSILGLEAGERLSCSIDGDKIVFERETEGG